MSVQRICIWLLSALQSFSLSSLFCNLTGTVRSHCTVFCSSQIFSEKKLWEPTELLHAQQETAERDSKQLTGEHSAQFRDTQDGRWQTGICFSLVFIAIIELTESTYFRFKLIICQFAICLQPMITLTAVTYCRELLVYYLSFFLLKLVTLFHPDRPGEVQVL